MRTLRDDIPMDEDLILFWRERYLQKLSKLLEQEQLYVKDVIACVDAWISGWASTFLGKERVEADPQAFLERQASYEKMLPAILS